MNLEEGKRARVDFLKLKNFFNGNPKAMGIVPVVVQDAESMGVLMLAYANSEALEYTLKNKVAAFWSTSRNELWVKGMTSGNMLKIVEVRINCEQNSLLYLVRPLSGGACHVKDGNERNNKSCFYRSAVFRKKGKLKLYKC